MLACSNLALGATTSPTSRGARRRRRRFVAYAAAKKDAKAVGSARLARILRQYDETALAEQQAALEEYQDTRGDGKAVRARKLEANSERKSTLLPSVEHKQERDDKRSKVFRYDPERRMEVAVRGGLGGDEVCWWALWVKVNREKQVAEALERLAAELPPVVGPASGAQMAREVQAWAPTKLVKAWNPKTNKMGSKTLRYEDGGVVLLRCVLDDQMELLLQRNINVLGFKHCDTLYNNAGQEEKFPVPCSPEFIAGVQQWERDLSPIDEAEMRKMLGLPSKELADTLREAAEREEAEEERKNKKRDGLVKSREWFEGDDSRSSSPAAAGRRADSGRGAEAERGWYDGGADQWGGRQGQQRAQRQGAGEGGDDDVSQDWAAWWEEEGGATSSTAGSTGRGALGAGLEDWGMGRSSGDDTDDPVNDGQLRALERLGHDGPLPATRGEASAAIDALKERQRAGKEDGPPSEGQMKYLDTLGYQGPPPATRAAATELISSLRLVDSGRPDPRGPPSEGQLRYLQVLGYSDAPPATRAEAGDLIDQLKAQQGPGAGRRAPLDPQGPASEGQLELLGSLSYEGPAPATRAEADRLIDDIKASRPRRFDPADERAAPSEGQLRYLSILGHSGPIPPTKAGVRELIDRIKKDSAARGPGSFATPKPDPTAPPSEGQRRYLTLLGYEGETPGSRREADELIDELKAAAEGGGRGGGGAFDPKRPASEGQRRYLAILGAEADEGLTRAQADELIERLKRERLGPDPEGAPSEGQMRCLAAVGYRGPPPATRARADEIIDGLKARRGEWRGRENLDGDREGQRRGREDGLGPDPQGRPSVGQLGYLENLGYTGEAPATRGEATLLIDQLKAAAAAARGRGGRDGWGSSDGEERGGPDPAGPPSEGQLRYLGTLGHEGEAPATRAEAGELISSLKRRYDEGPPGERQLRFLESLGHEGAVPATRAEADALISSMRGAQQHGEGGGWADRGAGAGWGGPDPQGPPSQKQLGYLQVLGYEGEPPATRGEASNAIDELKAAQAASRSWGGDREGGPDPYGPPSEGQLRYLSILGYGGDELQPATREVADALINTLKAQHAQQGGAGAGRIYARGPPTEGQLQFLGVLGHTGPVPATKGEADELIRELKGGRQQGPDPQGPPSHGQMDFLQRLGHAGAPPATRAEAGALIDALKAEQAQQEWRGAGRAASSPSSSSAWSDGWYVGGSDASSGDDDDALSYFGIDPSSSGSAGAAGEGAGASATGPSFNWGWDDAPGVGEQSEQAAGGGGGGEDMWGAWQQPAAPAAGGAAGGGWQQWGGGAAAGEREPRARRERDDFSGGRGRMERGGGRFGDRDRADRPPRGPREGRREFGQDRRDGPSSGGWDSRDRAPRRDEGDADLSWWDEAPGGDASTSTPAPAAAEAAAAGSGASSSVAEGGARETSTAAGGRRGREGAGLWDLDASGGEFGEQGPSKAPTLSSHPLTDLEGDDASPPSSPTASSAFSGRRTRQDSGRARSGRDSGDAAWEGASAGSEGQGGAAAEGLAPGAQVAVTGGSFQDFEGRIVSVEGARVRAELDIFGRPTQVELDTRDIKPL